MTVELLCSRATGVGEGRSRKSRGLSGVAEQIELMYDDCNP